MRAQTDARRITIIAIFAALSIVLNLSKVNYPAPFAPYLIYQIWEIPIVAAFLLFGPKIGVITSIINTLVLLVIFPGALPTGPLYNLAALLSMLMGIYIVHRVASLSSRKVRGTTLMFFSTATGLTTRVGMMTLVNSTFLPQPPPIGFGIPTPALLAALPLIGFFNATLALYTIPLGYFLTRAVCSSMNIAAWYGGSPPTRMK
jgi:riboflavin transporter FmnP